MAESETMGAEVDHMDTNGSTLSTWQRHPVATTLAWLFGAIATALTALYLYMLADAVSNWSGYTGYEPGFVRGVLVVSGVIVLFAWGATAIAITATRNDQ